MIVFGLLWAILCFQSQANSEIISQIHDIDFGNKTNDEILILLESGHVLKLSKNRSKIISHLGQNEKKSEHVYRFKFDQNRFINSIQVIDVPNSIKVIPGNIVKENIPYVPTTVTSIEKARRYHQEARYNPKESQCFNRAMVWTYEWWKNHELRSNKIFIFFTRNYIRKFNFEWWFHVAPYVHVLRNGEIVERVLDIKYTSTPTSIPNWTNIFMKNNARCPVISNYSDYADFPYEGDCYIQRTHMFTYQPSDLQMYEAWGYTKTNFNFNEVRNAYLEAFDEEI